MFNAFLITFLKLLNLWSPKCFIIGVSEILNISIQIISLDCS
uniref:Uncharacterized protein n=1 Tax=Polysiphonia elongata TaxID=159753 RepID=A0A1Z1MBQ5_9FLOR|nr:hypothetical protein [Polysiphonia elongata]ARW63400.1 hypothetical protein [Polysiphonia elongata]